jgi:altronate dehydratase small subunit
MAKAIIINQKDNVAVMIEPVKAGGEILVDSGKGAVAVITAATDIPAYHKTALTDIAKGGVVTKYGEEIGIATQNIPKGSHVHIHNVTSRQLLESLSLF